MAKKRRKRSRPTKGSAYLSGQSPESKWINQWKPPKGFAVFFLRGSDADFARKHPIGYPLTVVLGIIALLSPSLAYGFITNFLYPGAVGWPTVIGCIGAFIIGVGLFNFVAIIVRQYLGHLVSILSFLVGGIMVAISLRFL